MKVKLAVIVTTVRSVTVCMKAIYHHLPLKPWLQMSQYAVISLSVSLVLILFWTISFNGDISQSRALKKLKF